MEQTNLVALQYLDEMAEKVVEVLKSHVVGETFTVSKEQPFPQDLMRQTAQVVIDVAVVNETGINAFHVVPLVEGHLYMLDVQDKKQQTVASVIYSTKRAKANITIEDVLVAFKSGAIIGRYEELLEEQYAPVEEELVEAQG